MAALDAWLVFEDEAGFSMTPICTFGRCGRASAAEVGTDRTAVRAPAVRTAAVRRRAVMFFDTGSPCFVRAPSALAGRCLVRVRSAGRGHTLPTLRPPCGEIVSRVTDSAYF